eukprot:TRINITY_DN17361_c0_g1_i3.p2 TRINITY_DN17361_c0_g1~~TRINITY_DN17361_c0_g1_i3.p2  ORF type:complete len:207 (+),score=46.69 TRINITY_DN17361_c0_g1_i3:202-822(+)
MERDKDPNLNPNPHEDPRTQHLREEQAAVAELEAMRCMLGRLGSFSSASQASSIHAAVQSEQENEREKWAARREQALLEERIAVQQLMEHVALMDRWRTDDQVMNYRWVYAHDELQFQETPLPRQEPGSTEVLLQLSAVSLEPSLQRLLAPEACGDKDGPWCWGNALCRHPCLAGENVHAMAIAVLNASCHVLTATTLTDLIITHG